MGLFCEKGSVFTLHGFTHASVSWDVDDQRTIFGYIFNCGWASISSCYKKQDLTSIISNSCIGT